MVLGELDSNTQKNETRPLSYTIHKNKLKMDKDLNMIQETIKMLEEKAGKDLSDLSRSNFFNIYLFLGQRETEHEQGRGRERATQNLKQAPGSELSAQSPTRGSNSRTMRS